MADPVCIVQAPAHKSQQQHQQQGLDLAEVLKAKEASKPGSASLPPPAVQKQAVQQAAPAVQKPPGQGRGPTKQASVAQCAFWKRLKGQRAERILLSWPVHCQLVKLLGLS